MKLVIGIHRDSLLLLVYSSENSSLTHLLREFQLNNFLCTLTLPVLSQNRIITHFGKLFGKF